MPQRATRPKTKAARDRKSHKGNNVSKAKSGDKRIGNKFGKNAGRKPLFKTVQELWERANEYFDWIDKNPFLEERSFCSNGKIVKSNDKIKRPYTIHGLTEYVGCNTVYFAHFKTNKELCTDEFSKVIKDIEDRIYNQKFSGAASGFFNSNLIARDLGLADKMRNEFSIDIPVPVTGMEIK